MRQEWPEWRGGDDDNKNTFVLVPRYSLTLVNITYLLFLYFFGRGGYIVLATPLFLSFVFLSDV